MFRTTDILQIVHIFFHCLIFCFGAYIHKKTVQVHLEEKNKTWRMHVLHAVVVTIFFGFQISFGAIIHFLPSLASYTGSWICYIGSFTTFYGYHTMLGHSIWISIEKYVFIVHSLEARVFGDEKIEKIFFLVDLIVPGLLSISAMTTADYESRPNLKNCFAGTEEHIDLRNSSLSLTDKFLFCDGSQYSGRHWIIPYVVRFTCVSRAMVNIITAFNILEGFFYFKIFKSMKRQTNPAPENPAANSLAADIQDRNIRKVILNARVTYVLWLIEIAAMLWLLVFWVFVFGSSTPGSLTNAMVWFFIIIPYIHLMNTKYNKDRILDDGWKKVILNSVMAFSPKIRRQKTTSEDNLAVSKIKEPESEMTKESETKKIDADLLIVSIEYDAEESNVRPSTSNEGIAKSESIQPDERQSEIPRSKRIIYPDSSIETETDDEIPKEAPKSYHLQKGTEILALMWSSLEIEDAYIHYFRQLLKLEDLVKDGKSKQRLKKFEVVLFSNFLDKPSAFRRKTSNPSRISQQTNPVFGNVGLTKSKGHKSNELQLDVTFIGELLDRIEQRRYNMAGFLMSCENDTLFEDFVAKLISFEEELID